MTVIPFESALDRATFHHSGIFGGIDLMAARFVRHSFAPHSHDELMIGVIRSGVKAFQHGRTRQLAAAGSLSVVNPGEMHTGEREAGNELIYAALYLPSASLATMLGDQAGDDPIIRPPVVADREIWGKLSAAHRLATEGDDAAAEEEMICGISLLFGRFGTRKINLPKTACPKPVGRALEFLHASAGDPVSLAAASKAAGVGLFHLIRLFQTHVGLTPHAYLTQIRIAKSRQLLELGTPVAQVALEVGFADQAHFTKRFKQLTGTTPAAYARSMR